MVTIHNITIFTSNGDCQKQTVKFKLCIILNSSKKFVVKWLIDDSFIDRIRSLEDGNQSIMYYEL